LRSTLPAEEPSAKYVQDNVLLENQLLFEAYFSTRRTKDTPMAYPAGHRTAVKRIIIDSARKLFNRYGFENVSLHQIMSGAGLTHGGFYSYFQSKSDLYAEVLACFFTDPNWKDCWKGVHVDLSSTDVGAQVVRAYLSRQHFEDVENSCPMVALPTDVAHSGKTARRAFETVFKAMVSVLERSLIEKNGQRRVTAQAIAALSIGGMVIARAVVDRTVADELRDACMAMALKLGGWDKSPEGKNRKSTSKRSHRAAAV
jgi:AcrR family transcriptional regulator